MHLLLAPLLATLTTALPTTNQPQSQSNTTTQPTNFHLLTTTSPNNAGNTSTLPSVSATSLLSPLSNSNYLLRLIGPGYNSLPTFNLTSTGTLETEVRGPHGIGEFEYNSTRVRAGEELDFAPEEQKSGNLGLEGGFLLTVGGESVGWKVCEGEGGQRVVAWKGEDESCTDTYVQAALQAPY